MDTDDAKPAQIRVSLEPEIVRVLRERKPGSDSRALSRFANDCLRAYFLSKGWIKEDPDPPAT